MGLIRNPGVPWKFTNCEFCVHAKGVEAIMKTSHQSIERNQPEDPTFALCRQGPLWAVTFQGRQARFKHERGALYVACLLLNPPPEPLHAVALALKAREMPGPPRSPDQVCAEHEMGVEEAEAIRALWRKQRELERLLEDRTVIEPVKAEALDELEKITDYLRQSPWLTCHGAERCVRAVSTALKRFHAHLAAARDAEGRPDGVLRSWATHLYNHLLLPSGRSLISVNLFSQGVPLPPGIDLLATCAGAVARLGQRRSRPSA
jgi:hypothetical protein